MSERKRWEFLLPLLLTLTTILSQDVLANHNGKQSLSYFVNTYSHQKPTIGSIEILLPLDFEKIFDLSSKIEIVASHFSWSEGPVWIYDNNKPFLLFSDTIQNRIYKWEEGPLGKSIFLDQSGCRLDPTHCKEVRESGSNGLLRKDDKSFDLIAALHGDRAIALLYHNGTRSLIATHYKDSRLNSPNDVTWSNCGNLYFTDPPYGLIDHQWKIHNQELKHSGVYLIRSADVKSAIYSRQPTNRIYLLEGKLPRPNGLTFSPDFKKLYVTNSDFTNPVIMVYDVREDGTIHQGKVFFDALKLFQQEKALGKWVISIPDGIKVDTLGNVFTSGPGGVLVISPDGKLLGRLLIDRPVSNLVLAGDGHLYITAKDIIARIPIKTKPVRLHE